MPEEEPVRKVGALDPVWWRSRLYFYFAIEWDFIQENEGRHFEI